MYPYVNRINRPFTHGPAERTQMIRRKTNVFTLVCLLCFSPNGSWAQDREATLAVVNPALRSPLRQTLSLDGDWEFATDLSAVGEKEKWFSPHCGV